MIHLAQNELSLRQHVAKQLGQRSVEVADQWLNRLVDIVDEKTRDIFPTDAYLDHIPQLVEEVARVLGQSDDDLTLVNAVIDHKATELGELRHQQDASVNQLLREYDILSKILEEIIIEEAESYPGEKDPINSILVIASVSKIVRSILQSTVDSFVERYTYTIEQQTEKLMAFNTFVSHELKTPLQAASLNLELLLDEMKQSDRSYKDLSGIQRSLQQAISMLLNIESLMKRSDSDTEDEARRHNVDICELIKDIELLLGDALYSRGVKIKVQPDIGELYAESEKLKLIFTNLLSNAIKYSDPDKGTRLVEVEKVAADDVNTLKIIVKDNGLGIDEKMMDEVLKMRVRAHESLDEANDVSGFGLGLYLVGEAVREMKGELKIESEAGQGTLVHLSFPRA